MMTLHEIAQLIDGTIIGDSQTHIDGVASIVDAAAGELTFAKSATLVEKLVDTSASAAIIPKCCPQDLIESVRLPVILVDDVVPAFSKVVSFIRRPLQPSVSGVSPLAFVSPTAQIGDEVTIYPGAFIADGVVIGSGSRIFPGACILEQCVIGNRVTIFPNAVLYERTKVDDQAVIHSGAVIGAFGFGYDSRPDGHHLSDQSGNVELGKQVEIGACTTIDRGTYGATRIGAGSKLDNQVMIGHNCQIGDHNLLCSQVGIAGSCRTGQFVVMAGQVGIGDHINIGDHVTLGAKSGVMHDLPSQQTYLGAPAKPAREEFQLIALHQKLPQLRKQLKVLEKKIAELEMLESKLAAALQANDAA